MDEDLKYRLVPLVGLLLVAGILYESLTFPSNAPSGYVVAAGATGCCGDCSCISDELCVACDGCIWVNGCSTFKDGVGLYRLELVHSGRVEDGGSFVLNAVVNPAADGKMLLKLGLPNGFSSDRESVLADLKAGEAKISPFRITVKKNVAQQDHLILVELVDDNWTTVSRADATVSVYWEH